ncbi:aldo/keto reductase [Streptomyces sp. NPDC050422]|uniref:aldo/keto reductase n=1 Tax=Streptomyces sp. NPDC050422 TaxID=3365614 RepID=UPI0037A30DFF
MTGTIHPFADAAGHAGFSAYDTANTTVYRNGKKYASYNDELDAARFELPAGRAYYRLETTVDRSASGVATASPKITWQTEFVSARTAGATPVPTSVVRYAPELDLDSTAEQVAEAQAMAPIVCVQNMYNLAYRQDDELIDDLADKGIAYVPFFPLGGFTPLQSTALSAVATRLEATSMSVALSWLLRRSPNILLIPGTSSVAHLRENVAGAGLPLSDEDLAELDKIGQ